MLEFYAYWILKIFIVERFRPIDNRHKWEDLKDRMSEKL